MKNRKAIFTLLCAAALVLGACFSSWQPDGAILTLYMGGETDSRAAYPPDSETRISLEHKIKLSGPEEMNIEPEKGVETVQIAVTPGYWAITIHSYLDGELIAEGSGSVTAVSGQYNPVEIQMRYVGVDDNDVDDNDVDYYTVTFNSGDGSGVPDQIVKSGDTATRPANPTLSGYTFDNWYGDLGLTAAYDFSTPVTGNITLYAKWIEDIEDIGDIGISFQWDEKAGKITVGGFDGVITISKTGASSFTAQYSGAGTVRWYVWGLAGSGSSITINAADYNAGTYQLVAEATIDGVPYSAEISFVVAD